MWKNIGGISKVLALLVCVAGIVFGIIYLRLTVSSERELWRITDKNLSDPILLNDVLLFKGDKGEFPLRCEYIHAVNKNTGEAAWSSESFTDQYCDRSVGSVSTAIILLAEKEDMIFVSSMYGTTDDELEYVLYALNSSNGELLWKIDGYAGYPYSRDSLLVYSLTETNHIYMASKEGSFLAVDYSTGKQAWQHKIPKVAYDEDILIEYNNQIVYYYDSGNRLLIAFNAKDGSQVWEVPNQNNLHHIIFSDQLTYLVSWSDNQNNSFPNITALDTITGKQVWQLPFAQESAPWAGILGDKIYILNHGGKSLFGDFRTPCSLFIVNENTGCTLAVVQKDTGELAWQFNEDYSHGNLYYLVQDNVVYIGTNDGFLFALDEQTGKTIWQAKAAGATYYIHVEGNTLLVINEENCASAFDTKTGAQKWKLNVGVDTIYLHYSSFVMTNERIAYIAGAKKRKVYALDLETGKELWSWDHFYSGNKGYYLAALDDSVLYVDQYRPFLGYDWFFALKTNPD